MKKFTLALIAIALVCTSVFAATTVTGGFGFGGFFVPQDLNKVEALKKYNAHYVYDFSLATFAGIDYVRDNGLTIYDDLAINLTIVDDGHKDALKNYKFSTLTEYAGLGYTFTKDAFTFMVGGGFEAKAAISGMKKFGANASFAAIGAGFRGKVSYAINDYLAITGQLNTSLIFHTVHNGIENVQIEDTLAKTKLLISGNTFVGVTYAF